MPAVIAIPPVRALVRRWGSLPDPRLRVRALGLEFPSPLGAAAGVDKDASWVEGLGALGFGFVEVGTVTAMAQPGTARPRIARSVRDRALVNRMGFPNPGAALVARRLRGRARHTLVGVNVGRSKLASPERAADDYRASVREVAAVADYLVLNVSSPNTPGLRDMQAVDRLEALVAAVRSELAHSGARVALLVKIAPDLDDERIDAVADTALRLGLDGIVATNTTTDRSGLSPTDALDAFEGGGVSGAPLRARSLAILARLRARVGDDLVLISVGGIETADDAWQRILAGATLLQAYTGFVYGGPAWPRRINRELARRVAAARHESIQELVGTGEPGTTSTDDNPSGTVAPSHQRSESPA